jgi:hypothetical protein
LQSRDDREHAAEAWQGVFTHAIISQVMAAARADVDKIAAAAAPAARDNHLLFGGVLGLMLLRARECGRWAMMMEHVDADPKVLALLLRPTSALLHVARAGHLRDERGNVYLESEHCSAYGLAIAVEHAADTLAAHGELAVRLLWRASPMELQPFLPSAAKDALDALRATARVKMPAGAPLSIGIMTRAMQTAVAQLALAMFAGQLEHSAELESLLLRLLGLNGGALSHTKHVALAVRGGTWIGLRQPGRRHESPHSFP